jgi:cell division transport system ATP-binding protein
MSYEIVDLLREINIRGTTVIMVTHDITVVKKFNFRTIKLTAGKIVHDTSLLPENADIYNSN